VTWEYRLVSEGAAGGFGDRGKPPVIWVVCHCARWCHVCEDYRSVFDQVRQTVLASRPESVFLWLDIDDDDALVEPLEVDNLPTLLIAVDETPRFFGPLTPHASTLERMVRQSALDGSMADLTDPAVRAVVTKLRLNHHHLITG
jgi:hypothetical protein